MLATARSRRPPTDDWRQLRLLVGSPEQEAYELLRPLVLFGQTDGHRLHEVDEPRLYATDHASPQPFLSPVDEVEWHPAQRLAPYRPRRQRRGEGTQARLLAPEPDAATG